MADCKTTARKGSLLGIVRPPPYPGYLSIAKNISLSATTSPKRIPSFANALCSGTGPLTPLIPGVGSAPAATRSEGTRRRPMSCIFPMTRVSDIGYTNGSAVGDFAAENFSGSILSPIRTTTLADAMPTINSPATTHCPAETANTLACSKNSARNQVTSPSISRKNSEIRKTSLSSPTFATAQNKFEKLTNGTARKLPDEIPVDVAPLMIDTRSPQTVGTVQLTTPKTEIIAPLMPSLTTLSTDNHTHAQRLKSSSDYGSSSSTSDIDGSPEHVTLSMHRSSTSSGYGTQDASPYSPVASPQHNANVTQNDTSTTTTSSEDSASPSPLRKLYLAEKAAAANKQDSPAASCVGNNSSVDVISKARKFSREIARQKRQRYLTGIIEFHPKCMSSQHSFDDNSIPSATKSLAEDGSASERTGYGVGRTLFASSPLSGMALLEKSLRSTSVPPSPADARPASGSTTAEIKSPAAIKAALLKWCQHVTKGYANINITNFSSSWADGLAFCALIHHFLPDAFDFSSLDQKNRRYNFDLAFRIAEEKGGIVPLLETDDMIMMGNRPDWKCVYTYVQSFYKRFGRNGQSRP